VLAARGELVHVCVDDFSHLAYVELLTDERAQTAIGFLRRALAWFRGARDRGRASDER